MSEHMNLVPVNGEQLPATQIGSDAQFADLAHSRFPWPLAALHQGKAGEQEEGRPRQLRHPCSDDEATDLGDTIHIIPLARRPKAIDMTDSEAIIVNYDPGSAEFKRIAEKSMEKESHCMYGPSFLVYEDSQSLPGVLLRQQVGPQRSEEALPVPAADAGRHRRQGGGRRRCERSEAARADPADAQEPAGREGHVLLARSGRRQVRREVREVADERAVVKEITTFLTVKDNGVERAPQAGRRSRPLVVICSLLDLPLEAPAGLSSSRRTAPGERGRPRIGSVSGDVLHGRVYASPGAARPRRGCLFSGRR